MLASISMHSCNVVYSPEHYKRIRNYVSDAHPERWPCVCRHKKLHNHDYYTSCQSASQQRKAQEQHQPSLPRDTISRVGEAIGRESRFVDTVDNEHAEGATNTGNPVNEGDVNAWVGAIHGRLGPYGYID